MATIEANTKQRLRLLQALPQQGKRSEMRVKAKTRKKLEFSAEDKEAVGMREATAAELIEAKLPKDAVVPVWDRDKDGHVFSIDLSKDEADYLFPLIDEIVIEESDLEWIEKLEKALLDQ